MISQTQANESLSSSSNPEVQIHLSSIFYTYIDVLIMEKFLKLH